MDTKDTTMISLRLSADELQTLDTKAVEAGMNRTDYIRTRLFAPDNNARVAELERQLHQLTDRLKLEAERQEARRCSDPEHARMFGVGHCFICDIPMQSSH